MATYSDPNVPITTGREQTFVIQVESNPTTGYRWQPAFEAEALALERQEFQPHSAGLGSGGVETFAFKALKSGQTQIRLTLQRPWAQHEAPADVKMFTVQVD